MGLFLGSFPTAKLEESNDVRMWWTFQDLPGALDDASVTEALNLHKIKNRQWAIFKTSALKGDGLFEGLDW